MTLLMDTIPLFESQTLMNYAARRAQLKQQLADSADVIALVPGANLMYYTGLHYHLSERPIIALFAGDDFSVIVPEVEMPQLSARPDLEARAFIWNDKDGYQGAVEAAVAALGMQGKTLGADDKTMRLFEWMAFLEADPTMKLEELGGDLLRLRSRKDADEIAAMRQAIAISEQALATTLPQIQAGMTEREIAALLDNALIALGTHDFAFRALVQTGPNSALPHGNTTDRALQAGEFLLIDFGGMFNHYPADITRTYCLGEPSDEMQRIYDAVLAANRAACAAARPGVECGAVDAAAREVITAAGYGEYFIHRTGHGLGLETHELPQMAANVEDVLEPGMVFTVEPGIYIPGMGGVRIEDDVLVTDDGVDVLTSFPRTLRL
ncbi:MAG: aminopeptidase P family protein [Armatimonadetes bacterium]|nr:aminopeptidase P family protein [Anaerolineae bacterium]